MVEDAQTLRLQPDTSQIWPEVVQGPCQFRQPEIHDYAAPSGSYDTIMKVTVRAAMYACMARAFEPVVTMTMQLGQQEFAVAALLIWSTTPIAHAVLQHTPIHRVPLEKWPSCLKNWLVECRQLGRITGTAGDERYKAWELRRLMTLCGRTIEEANWGQEEADRTQKCVSKYAHTDAHGISNTSYRIMRGKVLAQCAQTAVRLLENKPGDLWNWWKRRARNTPAGSSSRHRDLKSAIRDLPGVDLEMRPTKKAVVELFTEDDLRSWLKMTPRCIARTSTKHEPGRKNRALFAQDDEGATIAAFASEGMERSMKTGGMVLSQMPEDVKEWIAAEAAHVYMVSNDYTNFNILHSPGDLALVSISLAAEWMAAFHRSGSRRALHKAVCELWTAESYKLMFTQGKSAYRVVCGLYSGHRNTARDNTLLHRVYLSATQSIMAVYFGGHRPVFERMSGDDEVVHYSRWCEAVTHPLISDGAGFKSKVEKGLLAKRNDEFLQFMRYPGNMPRYPVAHTILTFCSGNWYKTPVRDLGATVPAMEDHAWDLVLGGVPVEVARKLAADALDYIMQTKDRAGNLRPKEWWKFRGANEIGGHPLWGCGKEVDDVPTISLAGLGAVVKDLPCHATQDLVSTEFKYWEAGDQLLLNEAMRQRTVEAYASVMRHELTELYDEAADTCWPDRAAKWTSVPSGLGECPIEPTRAELRRLRSRKLERLPPSIFAVCMKYNIPPELVKREPGRVLAIAEPRARSELLAAIRAPETTKRKAWAMPGLLRTDRKSVV